MKFTKTERLLHPQPQYTPASNQYHLSNPKEFKKIGTGSLVGPAFINKQTFGFSKRFDNKNATVTPGPGTYNNQKSKQIQIDNNNYHGKLLKGILRGNGNQNVPSIPYSYYGQQIDQQQQNYINELKMNQNLIQSTKKILKNPIAYSFNKSQKNLSYIPKNSNYKQKQQVVFEQEYQNQNNQRNNNQKKTSIQWKQKIQKSNQRRKQIINLINPQFVPSLELIQIMAKRKTKYVPGPGAYSESLPKSQLYQRGAIFSSVKRFPTDKESILGPGIYQINNQQKNKRGYSFNRSEKQLFQQELKNIKDYHRFYINPNPQKKQKSVTNNYNSPFGCGSSRFTTNMKQSIISTQESIKKNHKNSIINKIKVKSMKRLNSQKQQGLLGISTMVSTID